MPSETSNLYGGISFRATLGILVGLGLVCSLASLSSPGGESGRSGASEKATGLPRLAPEALIELYTPEAERRFLKAVENARDNYMVAPNDMARGATRPHRARRICAALQHRTALTEAGWAEFTSCRPTPRARVPSRFDRRRHLCRDVE